MFRLKLSSPVPIYEQVIEQVKRMIEDQELRNGDALPTIRSLASQLDVAINTIAKAYQELESRGLVETRGAKGTFVRVAAHGANNDERFFRDAIRRLLQRGMNRREIEQAFKRDLSLFFD